jgi:phosphoglycerate dehydrogenase-like enzyme
VLNIFKDLNGFFDNQKQRLWQKNREIRELCGSTVAVIGCGSVGTECAKRFRAFGTKILGVDLYEPSDAVYDRYFNIENIKEALSLADVIVITLPLTEQTKGLFNADILDSCRKDAILVNISRGAVVDEKALCGYLDKGVISGAVLDVFENEPLAEDSPLWKYNNVIITPHNSFVSKKNTDRLFELCCSNLDAFLKGENK